MFSILGWILFGLIVGVIAKLVMPGRDPGGLVVTVLLGITGAVVAGMLNRFAGLFGPGDAAGLIMSVVAVLLSKDVDSIAVTETNGSALRGRRGRLTR
jgi:uncharacterized membrane protein YeaQ/YmgE (transglycosylase-associated protein family)